jgi:hypothetical protein
MLSLLHRPLVFIHFFSQTRRCIPSLLASQTLLITRACCPWFYIRYCKSSRVVCRLPLIGVNCSSWTLPTPDLLCFEPLTLMLKGYCLVIKDSYNLSSFLLWLTYKPSRTIALLITLLTTTLVFIMSYHTLHCQFITRIHYSLAYRRHLLSYTLL